MYIHEEFVLNVDVKEFTSFVQVKIESSLHSDDTKAFFEVELSNRLGGMSIEYVMVLPDTNTIKKYLIEDVSEFIVEVVTLEHDFTFNNRIVSAIDCNSLEVEMFNFVLGLKSEGVKSITRKKYKQKQRNLLKITLNQ